MDTKYKQLLIDICDARTPSELDTLVGLIPDDGSEMVYLALATCLASTRRKAIARGQDARGPKNRLHRVLSTALGALDETL